jgi:hypothetical protein
MNSTGKSMVHTRADRQLIMTPNSAADQNNGDVTDTGPFPGYPPNEG